MGAGRGGGYIGGGIQRQQGEGVGGWPGRGQGEHTAKCVQIYR